MADISIPMVNLKDQHLKLEEELIGAFRNIMNSSSFINGKEVTRFEQNLATFLRISNVISCANGTDALQIALMALELNQGDEVIIPGFTYVATAEAIALLGLKPVMVDVDENTCNISVLEIRKAITPRTKAIIPVHLFGQCCDMEPIMHLASESGIFVIEDNAQSLGAACHFSDGTIKKAGTIGHIGCTSFFPTKNLGCMGDGGALMTQDSELAAKIRMIANHGQKKKYYHQRIGCNSRLDTLQAAILNIKLEHFTEYLEARQRSAESYKTLLKDAEAVFLPQHLPHCPPTYNQFTLRVPDGKRDELKDWLSARGIPTMIYYPLPLYKQEAYKNAVPEGFHLPATEKLCNSVLSIPMHTELQSEEIRMVSDAILNFNKEENC